MLKVFRRDAPDPYASYARLRAASPAVQAPNGTTYVFSHALASSVLKEPRLGKDRRASQRWMAIHSVPGTDYLSVLERYWPLGFHDPPVHTRLRALVASAFSPRLVGGLRPTIEGTAAELLDGAEGKPTLDVVGDFARHLPVAVLAGLFGLPGADHARLRALSQALSPLLEPETSVAADTARARARTLSGLASWVVELGRERAEDPGGDLLSSMATACFKGGGLSPDELVGVCFMLLTAGHETTTHSIGNAVLALATHPDQEALWRERPELHRASVDELLRWDPSVQLAWRLPLVDLELEGGWRLPAGRDVVVVIGSANRDPRAFPAPDVLDLSRSAGRHLSFGSGPRHCLGATLARLQVEVALDALVTRVPRLRLAGEPVRGDSFTLRGLTSLPILWASAA